MWRIAAIFSVVLSASLWSVRGQSKVMGGEFCEFDTFEASCGPDEVIQMAYAQYGRMRLGKCVLSDLGFVGCSADVLDLVDRRCSGKRKCSIRMPDERIASRRPCMTELKMYLEANYTCQKVIGIDRATCRSCDFVKVTESSGYIASTVTRESGCGAAKCPWLIEAKPGQILDLTLINYGWTVDKRPLDNSCQVYATIKEIATSKTYTVCAGNKRVRHVYTSQSHALQLRIVTGKPGRSEKSEFLLQYKFIGCENLAPPLGGWARRTGDVITMGCNDTSETWSLKCDDNRWIGEQKECAGYRVGASGSIRLGSVKLPSGLSIVIIIAVAFVVGAFILCIGIIMFRKRYLQRTPPPEAMYPASKLMTSPDVIKDPLYMPPLYSQESRDTDSAYQDRPYRSDRENYTHIWERPLPTPGTDSSQCTCPTGTTMTSPAVAGCTGSGGGGGGGGGGTQRVPDGEYKTLAASSSVQPAPPPSTASQRRAMVYGNNTMARKECELPSPDSDNDPRYFQVDPETTFN